MPNACTMCARRKVKCDKKIPTCSSCQRSRLQCIYESPVRSRAKRKAADDIQERLDRYERILERNGLLTRDATNPSPVSIQEPSLSIAPRRDVVDPPRSQEHRYTYNDNDVWLNTRHGVNPQSAEEHLDQDHLETAHPEAAALASAALFDFGHISLPVLSTFHPSYDDAVKMWRLYVQNVDPLIKFVHVPTTARLLEQAAADPDSIADKGMECLLFAIYHIAITTLSERDAQDTFGPHWRDLMEKYHNAVRISLIGRRFYKTNDFAVLQALTLLVLAMRSQYDPDAVWTLSGIAVRRAQRMRLHQDGTQLDLKPFDTEMRRRLWWVLVGLDNSAGRLSGAGNDVALASRFWYTKRPLNVDDTDLLLDMSEFPREKQAATDMIFCLVRTDVSDFNQNMRPRIGVWFQGGNKDDLVEFEHALEQLKNVLEEKYIRYLDITNPLHYFTVALARAALDFGELQLRLCQGRTSTEASHKTSLLSLTLRIIEHDIACNLNPMIAKFAWFRQDYFQWGPLIWVLSELCHQTLSAGEVQSAWEKIDAVFECHPEILTQKRSIEVALGKLTLQAYNVSRSLLGRTYEAGYLQSLKRSLGTRDSYFGVSTPPKHALYTSNSMADTGVESMNSDSFSLDDLVSGADWALWEQMIRDSGLSMNSIP